MVRQSLLALTITSALLGCNSDSAGTSSDVTAPDSKFTEVRAHWAANYLATLVSRLTINSLKRQPILAVTLRNGCNNFNHLALMSMRDFG